ncbi:hypothetical protein GOBAR_AA40069 [Gossypium barbadense]|uniref:Uncharacterized protein n=1 Tax=Gossypium barbadense TaxID=3634 RepID=A0A2P5VP73_GOSBA|nr:hypothetical protein GOBAR_AA40069 [Gossypium barbadense]
MRKAFGVDPDPPGYKRTVPTIKTQLNRKQGKPAPLPSNHQIRQQGQETKSTTIPGRRCQLSIPRRTPHVYRVLP